MGGLRLRLPDGVPRAGSGFLSDRHDFKTPSISGESRSGGVWHRVSEPRSQTLFGMIREAALLFPAVRLSA